MNGTEEDGITVVEPLTLTARGQAKVSALLARNSEITTRLANGEDEHEIAYDMDLPIELVEGFKATLIAARGVGFEGRCECGKLRSICGHIEGPGGGEVR